MKIFIRISAISALFALFAVNTAQAAPVTQSLTGLSGDICCGDWSTHTYGSIPLAQGTSVVTNLESTVTVVDQGWGNEAASWTKVFLALTSNGSILWSNFVAGGTHDSYEPQYFSADLGQLTALNGVLASIDWSSAPNVTMDLDGNMQAYPGWAEHVFDSSYSVTSDVPEPGILSLLGLGLMGLAWTRSKKQNAA